MNETLIEETEMCGSCGEMVPRSEIYPDPNFKPEDEIVPGFLAESCNECKNS